MQRILRMIWLDGIDENKLKSELFPQWSGLYQLFYKIFSNWILFSYIKLYISSTFRDKKITFLFTSLPLDIDCCRKMQRVHANACKCDMWTVKSAPQSGALLMLNDCQCLLRNNWTCKRWGKIEQHILITRTESSSKFLSPWARLETWLATSRAGCRDVMLRRWSD